MAAAFVGQNGTPFKRAIVGITYPFSEYCVYRDASADINLFEYVLEGEGEVFISGEWRRVQAGDTYILRQNEVHSYRSEAACPMKKLWINYTAEYMPSFLSAYGIESGIYKSEGVKRYFERAYECAQRVVSDSYSVYNIAECINSIVHTLALERSKENNDDVYRIKHALDSSVYEKLSLDQLSAALHISKSNIIRIFKKSYGMTPYDYLLGLKIDTAKLLLKNTHMTVGEISERVQISDQHYFSSLFLERVGLRPKDYRNKRR